MLKTLIVSYLPRGQISKTKKILDVFLNEIRAKSVRPEHLDLAEDVPDFFIPERLDAYVQRDYRGKKLTKKQTDLMSKMDRMTGQAVDCDVLVLTYPMYNFSFPAPVKAYFDSIMLKGKTWDYKDRKFVGLMKGKKALVITTSGADYSSEAMKVYEHSVSLARAEFQFMGFDEVKIVAAQGVDSGRDKSQELIAQAQKKVRSIVQKWYS